MQRRKVDNRIRVLIENGVAERQRGLFVVVGDRGKDQVSASRLRCRERLLGFNFTTRLNTLPFCPALLGKYCGFTLKDRSAWNVHRVV